MFSCEHYNCSEFFGFLDAKISFNVSFGWILAETKTESFGFGFGLILAETDTNALIWESRAREVAADQKKTVGIGSRATRFREYRYGHGVSDRHALTDRGSHFLAKSLASQTVEAPVRGIMHRADPKEGAPKWAKNGGFWGKIATFLQTPCFGLFWA